MEQVAGLDTEDLAKAIESLKAWGFHALLKRGHELHRQPGLLCDLRLRHPARPAYLGKATAEHFPGVHRPMRPQPRSTLEYPQDVAEVPLTVVYSVPNDTLGREGPHDICPDAFVRR